MRPRNSADEFLRGQMLEWLARNPDNVAGLADLYGEACEEHQRRQGQAAEARQRMVDARQGE